MIPSEDSSDSNFVVKDLDFYREIFVSLAEDTKNKDEENVRMRAYIGELESQNKRLDNKCDRLQVESEASDEKTVMIALNNPPGIIQTYSKIDILSPYIITPIYEDPENISCWAEGDFFSLAQAAPALHCARAGLKNHPQVSTLCFSGSSFIGVIIWGDKISIFEYV